MRFPLVEEKVQCDVKCLFCRRQKVTIMRRTLKLSYSDLDLVGIEILIFNWCLSNSGEVRKSTSIIHNPEIAEKFCFALL